MAAESERERPAVVTRSQLRQQLAEFERQLDALELALANGRVELPGRLDRLRERLIRAAYSELDLSLAAMFGLACFACRYYDDFVERALVA